MEEREKGETDLDVLTFRPSLPFLLKCWYAVNSRVFKT